MTEQSTIRGNERNNMASATEIMLAKQMEQLTAAVMHMASTIGSRVSSTELCERLGIHRNTLRQWRLNDPKFPKPQRDGKWLLADIIEWERSKN